MPGKQPSIWRKASLDTGDSQVNGQQIDGLIRGSTIYQQLAEGSLLGVGEVAFYFGEDGRAAARMPDGKVRTGAWRIEGDLYRVDWNGGLQNSGSSLTKTNGSIVVRNEADGAIRSTISKIVPGNVEGL
jgi:hypothetical protein